MNIKAKLRKVCIYVLSISMALTCLFATACKNKNKNNEAKEHNAFIQTLGGVSETYKGAVSTEVYTTANDAASAYVQTEIVGNNTANIINTTSTGTLTEDQVTKLNLPAEISEGITSVEEIEVEYSVEASSAFSLSLNGIAYSQAAAPTEKVKVYIIKYANDYRYFTPAPITGKTISRSYYDSIFNYEKYKNCTYVQSMTMNTVASSTYNNENATLDITIATQQKLMYQENKIYMEQTISTTYKGNLASQMGGDTSTTICAYIEETDEGITCYVKMDDSSEWKEGYLSTIGFSSIEELTPFYDQFLDYSYFTKTDYGFELSEANAKQYINEALSSLDFDFGQMDLDMLVKFYVSNGVLSGMRQNIGGKVSVNQDGIVVNQTIKVTAEMSCTKYGTTVVEKPFA